MTRPVRWRRSTRSGPNGNCVEVNTTLTGVRDSKNKELVLTFSREALAAFISAAKAGEFTNK